MRGAVIVGDCSDNRCVALVAGGLGCRVAWWWRCPGGTMISNKFAEGFDYDNCCCDVSAASSLHVPDDGSRKVSRSSSLRQSGPRRSRESDLPEDYLANRVTFYMDDVGSFSNVDSDGSSQDLRKQPRRKKTYPHGECQEPFPDLFFPRRSQKRPSRKNKVSGKDSCQDSPDVHRQIYFKKLQGQVSEVLARERSLKRESSWKGQSGSRSPRHELAEMPEASRSQHPSRTGSRRRSPAVGGGGGGGGGGVERDNSIRSCTGSGQRRYSGSGKPRGVSRNGSSLTERFDLPHKNLSPKERRRRTVVLIVVVTFLFLVVTSVLVVLVTLTNSTFYDKTMDDSFLKRNQTSFTLVRKENEQLINSLGREEDNLFNATGTTSSREASTHATTAAD